MNRSPKLDRTMATNQTTQNLTAGPAAQLAGRLLRAALTRAVPRRCISGQLTIRLPSGHQLASISDIAGPQAHIDIWRWRGVRRLLAGGNIGFAEAYMDGDCDCADLDGLFTWALANDDMLKDLGPGAAALRWLRLLQHRRNTNSISGSRRNIAAHYDLGNDFYAAWLDAGMNYSAALYGSDGNRSLEAAQTAKLDRIVELLDLQGGERVLEIGCGWGALAERLAVGNGCKVTALTLSHQQLDYARERMASSGVADRAEVRLQDYREVEGHYDRIASIEMLEAVGQKYWPLYFDTLRQRLAPGGIAVLQVITIRPDRFEAYAWEPDFIQRYIFPGGMLPTKPMLENTVEAAGLKLTASETFGTCYVRTLGAWRARFVSAWPHLARKHFDERFRRMWSYYLSYCAAGFRAGELDVGLYRIERPSMPAPMANNPGKVVR